ncbi:MAG: protein-L-isoaspartate O-methyltransferase [Gammaproteobacteria bacterium]
MNLDAARAQMISQQLRTWEVSDQRVLDVMADMPRELFVPEPLKSLAYADISIPLGDGHQMLQPKIQARILQAVAPLPTDSVLEVGTGCGYLTACLARLAGSVLSLDIDPECTRQAAARLAQSGDDNVQLETADAMSAEFERSFDVIVIGGSLPVYDHRFEKMLSPGGRLFVVVGAGPAREARLVTRGSGEGCAREVLFETDIAPLHNAPQPDAFVF